MANRNPLRTSSWWQQPLACQCFITTERPQLVVRGNSRASERGSVTLQMAVIMVGVLFGLMGFAIDLGRLYSGRAELTAAANAIAMAQASQLIGTEGSLTAAASAGQLTYENQTGNGNKYDFGGLSIGLVVVNHSAYDSGFGADPAALDFTTLPLFAELHIVF